MGGVDVRTGSLSRGVNTFTLDRLDAILKSENFSYEYKNNPDSRAYSAITYAPLEMKCEIDTDTFAYEHVEGGTRYFSDSTTKLRAEKFCQELYGHAHPISISVARLDAMFSKIFVFKFEPLEESRNIIERASDLLERMPAWPLELEDNLLDIPLAYRASSIADTASRDARLWEQLQATTYVSSTVLRAAMSAVMDPGCSASLRDMTNIIATLLEIVAQLASTASNSGTCWRLFVVRAFLWTSWQRCQMIYFHLQAASYLIDGSSDGKKGTLTLRGTLTSPGITIHEMSKQRASLEKPAYMCGWNFELLRINPVCIGADFRRFHQRYNATFGAFSARCLAGRSDACKGDSPKSCQRFQGMIIEDQSAHDWNCSRNCGRSIWDETSYRSLSGARAVLLTQVESQNIGTLQYCNASDQTLAISHVWSHGQGGRPEAGLNNCLHLRYSRIARSLGCDSYWMDTPCIPDDHQLRAESIAKINEVFSNAKAMLVCDRDSMQIDISNKTTAVYETLLVNAIICDWNIRAWTFFEAFRARRTIHLLCKNNAVVSLKEIIQFVHHKGALDIGILLLAMPHFLPPLDDRILAQAKSEKTRDSFEPGHLLVETSGSLLSHRPASRPGDDLVIWSLLMSEKSIFYNAEAFWKSLQGTLFSSATSIRTGYLVSSAPRLKKRGFGWAPASPALHPSTKSEEFGLNGFEGEGSHIGFITAAGLVADWLLFEIDGTGFGAIVNSVASRLWAKSSDPKCPHNLARIRARYLQGYRWGAILCPLQEMPDFLSWWKDGGTLRRTIVVVCGTNEMNGSVAESYTHNNSLPTQGHWDENSEVAGWEWRGTYMWDDAEPLPQFRKVKKFLIV